MLRESQAGLVALVVTIVVAAFVICLLAFFFTFPDKRESSMIGVPHAPQVQIGVERENPSSTRVSERLNKPVSGQNPTAQAVD